MINNRSVPMIVESGKFLACDSPEKTIVGHK